MGVLPSASLLLGIRGKALDVESSTQGPWEGRELQPCGDLCRAPMLALCVGPRRSLCQDPALCVGRGAGLFMSGSGARCRGPALCVGPCALCVGGPGVRSADPQLRPACHPSGPAGPQLQSACHTSDATGPQLRSVCHPPGAFPTFSRREPQTLLFGGKDSHDSPRSNTNGAQAQKDVDPSLIWPCHP